MKLILVATKDTMIGAFMAPFVAHNEEEAKRNWGGAIAYQSTQAKADPSLKDLQLYKLGEFDDESGEIKAGQKFLANSQEFMIKEQKQCQDFTAKPTDQQE